MADALRFYVAEVDVFRPGAASASVGYVLGEAPIGATPPAGGTVQDSSTLLASDVGYVTPLNNPGGVKVYVPTLSQAIAVERVINLALGGAGAAVAWGEIRLNADGSRYADITGD